MTQRIEGWLCTEVDGLRVASHGAESASFENGELMCFGKLPEAVHTWLTRPAEPARVGGPVGDTDGYEG